MDFKYSCDNKLAHIFQKDYWVEFLGFWTNFFRYPYVVYIHDYDHHSGNHYATGVDVFPNQAVLSPCDVLNSCTPPSQIPNLVWPVTALAIFYWVGPPMVPYSAIWPAICGCPSVSAYSG